MSRLFVLPNSLLLIQLIAVIIIFVHAQTLTVTSTSQYVGDTANYTYTVSSHNNPQNINFNFLNWSAIDGDPFTRNSRLYFGGIELQYTPIPLGILAQITIASSQTLVLTITNILNPSSLKPYQLTIILINGNSILNLKTYLTMTLLRDFSFSPISYSNLAGKSSAAVYFNLGCQNYIDHNTILNLTFNTSLITITIPTITGIYTTIQTNGSVLISNWTNFNNGYLNISGVNIVNPIAAISYQIKGTLYLISGGVTYNIQTVTATVNIQPLSFNIFSISPSSVQYGTRTSLSFVISCNLTQINSSNSSNPSYSLLSYTQTQLHPLATSDCIAYNSSNCKYSKNNNYSLSNFQVGIGNFTSTTITVTTYTYFGGIYYPQCKGITSLLLNLQTITSSIGVSDCDSSITSQSNNITLTITAVSVDIGDIIYITGFDGIMTSTNVWTYLNINSTVWHTHPINSSNIITNASTGTSIVSIYITYNNPTYIRTNSLTEIAVYRGTSKYASIADGTSLPICSATGAKTIVTYSFTSSNSHTYSPISINLDMNMQIYDYKQTDYITLSFRSNAIQNQYFLASTLIGLTPYFTVNGIIVTYLLINDTAVKINLNKNVSLPTQTIPLIKIVIGNITNPPIIGSYWLTLTTFNVNGAAKQTLTTSSLPIIANNLVTNNIYQNLLKSNTIIVNIANSKRNLLTKNTSNPSSTVKLVLPTQLSCSNAVGNNLTVIWFAGVLTNNGSASGNTTNLQINLGICYISYFTGTIFISISQTYLNTSSTSASSTSTSTAITNYCGDGCFQCSSPSTCTNCFSSSYSTLTFFFNGLCYNSCPVSTFNFTSTICKQCHSSCASCNGETYKNCTTCSSNFTLSSSGYCESICGPTKFIKNGICENCHPNCYTCLSYNVCYVCKPNATLIGTYCSYANCNFPCQTCEGTLSTCLSCISTHSLYQTTCWESCPSGTYKKQQNEGSICLTISQSATYVPVTITGIFGMLGIILLRVYSNKKIGNQSRRSRLYQSGDQNINLKINILRTSSVLFSLLQLIAALVLIAKNNSFAISTTSTTIVIVGLILHFITNMIFLVGYIRIVVKNRIKNDSPQSDEENLDQNKNNLSLRKKIIIGLSVIFTYRIYKLLYANLFIDRQGNQPLRGSRDPRQSTIPKNNLEETKNQMTNNIQEPAITPFKQNDNQNQQTVKKNQNKTINQLNRQENIASRKPIRSNSFGDQNTWPIIQSTISMKVPQDSQIGFRKLNHPFLTYLTLTNLVLATGLILLGAVLQILKSQFINMLLWGIDCLIVCIFAGGLTGWDLWVFTNLTKEEQHSQMSSREQQEVNNTHENLKNQLEVDIKIEPLTKKLSPKPSPKRSSPQKPKLVQKNTQKPPLSMEGVRGSIKRQCDDKNGEKQDKLPVLKVFQDFDEKDDTVMQQKKSKKFSTKNLRQRSKPFMKSNMSVTHKNQQIGYVCDDLFINFNHDGIKDKDPTATSYIPSRHSGSPNNRSLQQETLNLAGQFQDQPPNFADISDISQDKPLEAINIVSSELEEEQLGEAGQANQMIKQKKEVQ